MGRGCRRRAGWPMSLLLVAATGAGLSPDSGAFAQFPFSNGFELSEAVYLDLPDHAAYTHVEQLKTYVASGEWDDTLDVLRVLSESYGEQVIEVGSRRYLNIRDFCHLQVAALPKDVLARYRAGVDPQAEGWYRQGLAGHVAGPLSKIVDDVFCSSWGDDALNALGEMALERGEYASARAYWNRLLPPSARVGTDPLAPQPPAPRLIYPDTTIPSVDINARLVLASILQGRADRAQRELADFTRLYPGASGQLGGRPVKYAEMLSSLAAASREWPQPVVDQQWPTFAGSPERTKIFPGSIDMGAKQWSVPLPGVTPEDNLNHLRAAPLMRRPGDDQMLARRQQQRWLLGHHPVVIDDLVLVNTRDEILAYNLHTGKPAWGDTATIFGDGSEDLVPRYTARGGYGVPRYTMTVAGGRLYARMGSPVTTTVSESPPFKIGYLVCLDLKAQGRQVWKISPEGERWAFEGSPVVDGDNLYVCMRRSEHQPQAHVACFDARTGHRRWLRKICAAQTLGYGMYEETTSNLLSLHEGTLYVNTNLGAVAALEAHTGRVKWINVYRHSQTGDLNQPVAHFYRDLTPCVYDDGRVFAAPADSDRIFAIDVETGETLWDTRFASDAIHLLGVGHGNLLASGDHLYWFNVASGKLMNVWPPENAGDKGYGRGLLAGDYVYWPTRDKIRVFHQRTGELRQVIELQGHDEQAMGGNLLMADHMLLISSGDRLLAFGEFSRYQKPAAEANTEKPAPRQPPAANR